MTGRVPGHPEEDEGWPNARSSAWGRPLDGDQGGFHYPESPEASRLWDESARHRAHEDARPDHTLPAAPRGRDDSTEPAAERFRRTTRARARHIPDRPRRGYWGLAVGAVLFVMVLGSAGDYTEPVARLPVHVLFWSLVSLGALAIVYRERRNGWEPAQRWPWPTAAVVGSVVAEALALGVGSAIVITGSLIVLGLGGFVLVLLD